MSSVPSVVAGPRRLVSLQTVVCREGSSLPWCVVLAWWRRGPTRPAPPKAKCTRHWLGSSLSSEPRGLAGLSVLWHAGVLARSKISGSLLHRLSRPWHGLGPGGSHRDQRYGAAPKFSSPAAGDRSSSCLAIAASASSSSDFRCCSFILERRLAKQFSHDTKLLKLNQTRDGEACVCWSSLNDPRVR